MNNRAALMPIKILPHSFELVNAALVNKQTK